MTDPGRARHIDQRPAMSDRIFESVFPEVGHRENVVDAVHLAQFHAELERIRATSPLETRNDFANHRVVSRSFVDAVVGDLRPMLLLLGGGAVLVLIVASASIGP